MATSDERREVAENLRYMDQYESIRYKEQFFDELAETVVGFEDYHDFGTVIEKLADLIDPTCEIVRPATPDKFGVCSACGALVNMRDAVANATNYLKPRYCPNCGARVVRPND